MTQKVHNASSGSYSKYKALDVKCSCTKCESPYCYAKRQEPAESCSCEDCRESNTCLFYNNRVVGFKSSHSDTTTSPRVSPFVASYIAPYVAPYVAPYLAPYIAPYIRHDYMTSAIGDYAYQIKRSDAGTNTVELCRKLVGTPKYSIEELKKKYLYKKKGAVSSNTNSYPYILDPDEIVPRKSEPTRHTLEVYETVSGTQRSIIESLKNVYLKDSNRVTRHTHNACQSVSETQRSLIESLKNVYLKDSNKAGHDHRGQPTQHTLEVYETVSETQKPIIESLKNIYLKDSNKSGNDSRGQPTRHTLEVYETVSETQKPIIESLKNIYLKDSNKSGHDSRGQPTRHTLKVYETVSETQKPIIESLKNIYLKDSNKSGHDSRGQPTRHTLQVYESVSETQRSVIESLKNVYLKDCNKSGHDSRGQPTRHTLQVYESVSETQRSIIESLKNVYLKESNKAERRGQPSRHTLEVYETVSETQKSLIETLKNVYLKGSTKHEAACCNELCSPCTAAPAGYVLDLKDKPAKNAGQVSEQNAFTHVLDNKWNTIEYPNNPYAKKYFCQCKDCQTEENPKPPTFDHPGYIVEVEKPKKVKKKDNNFKDCSCDDQSTNSNRSLPPPSGNSSGVGKNKHQLYHVDVRHNNMKNSNEYLQRKSGSRGYIYDVPKYNNNQTLDKSCACEVLKGKHFSSPYKPTKNAQDLLKDIVESQEDVILTNKCQKRSSGSAKQSKLPGYVIDLNSLNQTAQKTNYTSNNLAKTSNPAGYIFDVPKKKCECSDTGMHKFGTPALPINNTQVFNINRVEAQTVASDTHKNVENKVICECDKYESHDEAPKSEPVINNVPELPKNETENIEKGCSCKESEHKSKGSGCIYHVPKDPHAPMSKQCYKCSQKKSDANGYVYEVPKNTPDNTAQDDLKKTQPLPNKCQKDSCSCKQSEYKLKGPGFIYDVPKHAPTSRQGCKCSESTKIKSEAHGYVYDVPKQVKPKTCQCKDSSAYKPTTVAQDILKNIVDTQANAVESLTNKCQKSSCNCKESQYKLKGPGFIYDVPKQPYGPTSFQVCKCSKLAKTKSEPQGYEVPNYKPTKVAQEIFDNIIGTQASAIGPLTNKCQKVYCSCRESEYKLKGPGFIYDVTKCPHEAISAKMKPELNKYVFEVQKHMKQASGDKQKTCQCRESSKNKLDTTQTHNSSSHLNSPKRKSDAPGYIYEVPKYPSKSEKTPCVCHQKSHSDSRGYIYDVRHVTNISQKPRNESGSQTNATGSLPNKCQQGSGSCGCKESEYKLKGPGFIYDVPKHAPTSRQGCKCKESAKITPETHGYIFDVPKPVKLKTCQCKESSAGHNTTTQEQSNTTQIYSINRLETQFIVSDIHHNFNKKSCNCSKSSKSKSELSQQIFEVPKYTSKSKKKSCQCGPTYKRKSESHGYVYEVTKYKPTKTAQEIFKNILGTQARAIGLLPNKCRKNNCKKSEYKLKGPGFVYDVPKYPRKPTSRKSYESSDSAKLKSESHGYIYEVPRYMKEQSGDDQKRCACRGPPKIQFRSSEYSEYQKYNMTSREPCNTTQIFSINRLETQYAAYNAICNMNKKLCTCHAPEKQKPELAGYIYDVPKNINSKSEKSNCECSPTEKRESESHGYVYEVPKYEPNKNGTNAFRNQDRTQVSCECKTVIGSGFVHDLPRHPDAPTTRKSCECTDSANQRNKSESHGYIYEVPKNSRNESSDNKTKLSTNKKTCECKEPTKSKPESFGYEFTYMKSKLCSEDVIKLINKQKQTIESLSNQYKNSSSNGLASKDKSLCGCNNSSRYKSNSNAQDLFKDILEIQKNAIETLTNKYHKKNCDCNVCKKNELESSGFIYELPKLAHVSTVQENNCECAESSKQISDSPRYEVDLTKESCVCSADNEYEATKSSQIVESKSIPPESQNNCKQMLCTDTETAKLSDLILKDNVPCNDKRSSKDNLELNNCPCVPLNANNAPPTETNNDAAQCNTGKAMLSAEVMDVPYTEFNASVACAKSESTNKLKKLTKYDIFKRIKEAYKACSCKVCECIAGKPVKPDICKCKPCECTDCLSFLERNDFNTSSSGSSKCTCDGCNKSLCPVAMNKLEICDCSPCNCVDCARGFTKSCDCEPCQCVVCKARTIPQRQTLVVAPVGREQNVQRIACTCSPCDCIECGQVHRLTSSVMHEMSTGTNRHALCRCEICLDDACDQSGVDSCKCPKRNKVMNKPVEKDTHDFDIRVATIVQKPMAQQNNRKGKSHDTIAMFAAVPNTYPDLQSSIQECTCEEGCECISCVYKEHAINSIKSSQLFTSIETGAKSSISENRTFSSYHCQLCKTQMDDRSSLNVPVHMSATSKCMSECCDCIDCGKNESRSPQRSLTIPYNRMGHEQSTSKNNAKASHEINLQNNEISDSVLSGYSSIETSSKISCHKGYGMITQNSRNKNKSWESSCNSSGHDYPEYLIQFPKSTVEHCLKDVMESDMDKNVKLGQFNTNSNATEEQTELNSFDTSLAKENYFLECGITDSHNSEYICRTKNNCDVSCLPDSPQYSLHTNAKGSNTLDSNQHLVLQVNNRQCSHKPETNECHESNVKQTKDIDELQASCYVLDRRSSCNNNDESIYVGNRTIFNPMPNDNEFHASDKVFDHNIADHNTTNVLLPIHNEQYCTRKYLEQLPQSCLVSAANGLSFEDYERIRKTLKEAKEFTRELIKLLKMYEKANNDFDSVSEKLKISHASLLSGDINAIRGARKDVVEERIVSEEEYNKMNHELQGGHLQAPPVREILSSSSIIHMKRNISDSVYGDHDNDNMSQKSIIKDISNFQKMNESIALDPSHDFNSVLETNELVQIDTHLNKDEVCCESAVNVKMIEEHLEVIQNVQNTTCKPLEKDSFHASEENTAVCTVNNRGIRKKYRTHIRNYKKYTKLLRYILTISRKISDISSNASELTPVTKYHVTVGTSSTVVAESIQKMNNELSTLLPIKDSQELHILRRQGNGLNQILKKLETVFRNFEKDAVSLKTSVLGKSLEEYKMEIGSIRHELEETDTCPILKTKSSWNIEPRKNSKDLCIIPSMELDLKKMVHSIPQQKVVSKKRLNVPHHKNKALADLQEEVKKLLEMPSLQPQEPIHYTTDCVKENLIKKQRNKFNSEIEVPMPETSLPSFCSSNQFKNVDREVYCSSTNVDIAMQIRDLLNLAVEMMPLKSQRGLDSVTTATRVPSMGLLVDGRSVKTILTPTKSMAVVSCLPHTEKVLLTIRTITSDVSTGRYPATTIIYNPRVK
nr:uncharacterized protein LOC110382220 isoform X4 [Helicoverpa armigera]